MKIRLSKLLVMCSAVMFFHFNIGDKEWIMEKHTDYNLRYRPVDRENSVEYAAFVDQGMLVVKSFFGTSFLKPFDVYVHPNRHSLDSTWQKSWNMPDFKSQCWMVASGVANRLDVISPKRWEIEACEHSYANTTKVQQLITHELVHVYHGQHNASPDFSNVAGIDWLVEGLATYASGQCEDGRLAEVKKAVAENKYPASLDAFWIGKLKYGLSGSVVMFIDKKYGRSKLIELLKFNTVNDVLTALATDEATLLKEWKDYMSTP